MRAQETGSLYLFKWGVRSGPNFYREDLLVPSGDHAAADAGNWANSRDYAHAIAAELPADWPITIQVGKYLLAVTKAFLKRLAERAMWPVLASDFEGPTARRGQRLEAY